MLTSSVRLSFAIWGPRRFDREELESCSLGFKVSTWGFLQPLPRREDSIWRKAASFYTYCSKILFKERGALHCHFHKVTYFRFTRETTEGRWQSFLHMVLRVPRHLHTHANHAEIRKHGIGRGAIIVER